MNWFKAIFPDYYKEMKGLEIGILYNKYNNNLYPDKVTFKYPKAGEKNSTVNIYLFDINKNKNRFLNELFESYQQNRLFY